MMTCSQTRIAELETRIAELEKENMALKQENEVYKTRIEEKLEGEEADLGEAYREGRKNMLEDVVSAFPEDEPKILDALFK